jgi:signal transduction histidine kinase/CheY-like chemotaxis protein
MGTDRVLSVTMPGTIFSDALNNYTVWQTGNIFLLDEEGVIIAHTMPEIVESRMTFLDAVRYINSHGDAVAAAKDMPQKTLDFYNEMMTNEHGVGSYSFNNLEYQCGYERISTPGTLGWHIALRVPLEESPISRLQDNLIILAIIFFAISALISILIAGFVAKPYKRVSEQKDRLEKLNETIQVQSEKLEEAYNLTQLMMDATPVCSMLCTRSGEIFECNEESVKLFGMRDKQEFMQRFGEIFPPFQPDGSPSVKRSFEIIEQVFEEGGCNFEWMHQLPDGTPVPCEMTLTRIDYEGDYIVAIYARDLRTQKKMLDEMLRLQNDLKDALYDAQAANESKSKFLAIMSHEMRTPLNAIIGFSELLLNVDGVQGETKDRMEMIHNSGMTLLGIVNDILDISKIESGKFELHPIEYDVPSLINDIVTLNIMHISDKPVKFNVMVNENLPAVLFGDDLRVKRIFNNLLSNACKYTEEGSIDWKIDFEIADDTVWLISDVIDTGVGIKPEDQEKLFGVYSQVDTQANRRIEGTGLGLSIMKNLLDMMDGTIEVESEYGKGSRFSIRFRQGFVSNVAIGKKMAENLMSERYTASKLARRANIVYVDMSYARVLVVDDVNTNLDVVRGMLKPYGLKVDSATNGKQAIEMIRAEKPRYDAIFMDHMMPGMDGIEATHVIREELGTEYAQKIPIIALTANAIVGSEQMFLDNGFQAFISKPIDILILDSVLRKWVRDKTREGGYGAANSSGAEYSDSPICGPRAALCDADDLVIEGVDVRSGLANFGDDIDMYVNVLTTFSKNTRLLLTEIGERLLKGDLKDYAIDVHGIKGSAYSIFATQLGDKAKRLENLAKAGEEALVKAENGDFIEYAKSALDTIDGALATFKEKYAKPRALAPDTELLEKLREACGKYDVRQVDATMQALESYEYETGNELVSWLREQVDDMNFDEIYKGDWKEKLK